MVVPAVIIALALILLFLRLIPAVPAWGHDQVAYGVLFFLLLLWLFRDRLPHFRLSHCAAAR